MIERIKRPSILLWFLSLILAHRAWGGTVFYENPVLPGDHPDPSIIREGKDFWATCTSANRRPIFPLFHSTDLVNWEMTGAVFTSPPAWAKGDFWAPEIFERGGHFFVYYAAKSNGHIRSVGVATAERPNGPYLDHGPIVAQAVGSIDPAPAYDANGKLYLLWKEDGNSCGRPTPIWAAPLSADGLKLAGASKELIRNDQAWEGAVVEGPYVLRRGGWFYLFYSGAGCCGVDCNYAEGVARSRSLLGPWEKDPGNPILTDNDRWKCPGHGSIVEDGRGRYWFLHHAYLAGHYAEGRQGMLDEVKFGTDDWPTINAGAGCVLRAASPFGVAQRDGAVK